MCTTNNFFKHFVHFTHSASSLKPILQKCLHKLHGNASSNFTIPVVAQENICLNLTTLRGGAGGKPVGDCCNNSKSIQKCHFSCEQQ